MCRLDDAPAPKHVLVVDDHYIVRRGLTELLSQQPGLTVFAAVASAEEALEVVRREPVDLAIVDISLGGMDGLELTIRLKRDYPDLPVLILSMHDKVPYADRAQQAGAYGFVAKQEAGDEVLLAIRRILDGHTYYPACH